MKRKEKWNTPWRWIDLWVHFELRRWVVRVEKGRGEMVNSRLEWLGEAKSEIHSTPCFFFFPFFFFFSNFLIFSFDFQCQNLLILIWIQMFDSIWVQNSLIHEIWWWNLLFLILLWLYVLSLVLEEEGNKRSRKRCVDGTEINWDGIDV